MVKNRKKIMTIGTDPEFFLVDTRGFKINASRIPFFASANDSAKIGCDGCGDPVEIRPNPTPINKINLMIDDIDVSFKRIARYCYFNDLTLRAGAIKESRAIGGHIHFGSKDLQYDGRIDWHNGYIQKHVPKDILSHREKLISCLDTFFMPIANLLISEREILGRLQDNHGTYGTLGQYRPQDWGIEYRTPYSFLISPLLTKALFSLACLIGNNYTRVIPPKEAITLNRAFYLNLCSISNYRRGRKLYKTIKPIILQMMKYRSPNPQNDSLIISLFNLIEQKKKVKTLDVLCNYNLKKPPIPELTLFFSNDDYMRMMRDFLVDNIKNNNYGEVYIYAINKFEESNIKTIYLSKNMPKMKAPSDVRVVYGAGYRHKVIRNSIGFSQTLLQHYMHRCKVGYVLKYLNNLKLKIEDDDYGYRL